MMEMMQVREAAVVEQCGLADASCLASAAVTIDDL
jgi:hypothetical protein